MSKILVLLLVAASMAGPSVGSSRHSSGFHHSVDYRHRRNNKIVVGGAANWTYGFDYVDWASKNSPFYVNDTLVFKYEAPNKNLTRPHNVYMLPDLASFVGCNFSNATKVGNETQGTGRGFEFVLQKSEPYYFACGIGQGIHCNNGTMKFFLLPLNHRSL